MTQVGFLRKQVKGWQHVSDSDHLPVDICECKGNEFCDILRHKQGLHGGELAEELQPYDIVQILRFIDTFGFGYEQLGI